MIQLNEHSTFIICGSLREFVKSVELGWIASPTMAALAVQHIPSNSRTCEIESFQYIQVK